MAFAYPGPTNSYIPTTDLSNNLLVQFGRNVKNFALNQLVKLIPVTHETGFYQYFNPLDQARIDGPISTGIAQQFIWAAGKPRPRAQTASQGFEFRQYATLRRNYPETIELRTKQQAQWDVVKNTTEALARLAMTDRALELSALMSASGSYTSSHVATASADGGGFWSAGTETSPIIKKTLNAQSQRIYKDSAGCVPPSGLTLVINPNTASLMSASQEVHSIFVRSRYANELLTKGGGVPSNSPLMYGLPDYLYGYRVVIEDTVYVPYNRGNSSEAFGYVFPDNTAAIVSAEKEFVGVEGGQTYSTFALFVYRDDDMKVESQVDEYNRFIQLDVCDNRQVLSIAPTTGGLVTNLFS